jgi:hypothetical protein
MGVPIANNRYPFPSGYRGYVAFSPSVYVPWNGYENGANTPSSSIIGAVLQVVASGAPTDKQSLIIIGADGLPYQFQFLYAGTPGDQPTAFEVPLPNSGASTAAQVIAALLAVVSLAEGTDQNGDIRQFNWVAQPINATTLRLNSTMNGTTSPSLDPANMVTTSVAQQTFGQTGVSPAKSVCAGVGGMGAFLPGP